MRKNIKIILPEKATEFLASMESLIKSSTLEHYQYSLRSFHDFLNRNKIRTKKLNHSHIHQFMLELKNFGLVEVSRLQILLNIRVYLAWLYEQGHMYNDPQSIVTRKDFPKRPSCLPRPLPADVDKLLQHRLAKSNNIYHRSLLLMRFTGLRIGELVNLSYHCIRKDHNDYSFLKVPLGKLNNERIVPINSKTVSLIHKIQKQSMVHLKNVKETAKPAFLIYDPMGRRPEYYKFRLALQYACQGINTDKPIVSHRLRHTYATSLINAGMSLVGIMRLLGHHSYAMTLRYAAVTQETVKIEYFCALSKIESKYNTQCLPGVKNMNTCPSDNLSDAIRHIQKYADQKSPVSQRKLSLILKRMHRIRSEIQALEIEK